MIFDQHTIKVEFDSFGIEEASIMKFNSLAQLKGVDFSMITDCPGLCQVRVYIKRSASVTDQPIINIHQDSKNIDHCHSCRVH